MQGSGRRVAARRTTGAVRGAGERTRDVASGLTPSRWSAVVSANWRRAAIGWERFEPQFMYALSPVDPELIRALEPRPGDRVLDVGCGTGEPALGLAQLVAPRGSVLGLDISAAMLAIARRRARMRGIRNARFVRADMSRWRAGGARFDHVVSRFGLMFMDDLPAALGAARLALRRGGRIAAAVWGPVARNPIFRVRSEAMRPYLREPLPDPERSPHPLRLARPGLLAGLMRSAGFRNVKTTEVRTPFAYASADEYVEMNVGVPGPLQDLYLTLSRRDQAGLRSRLARGINRFRAGALIRVPGMAWVVSGRRDATPRSTS